MTTILAGVAARWREGDVHRRSVNLPLERLVPLIVACGLFMENLDSTVLGTALPAMAKSLDVNPLRLNLAITAYSSVWRFSSR